MNNDIYYFFKGISVGFREPRYVFTEPETQVTVFDIRANVRGTAAKQFSCSVEYTDGTAYGQCVCVPFNYYLLLLL